MINLDKIEKKVDDLLAKETSASLNHWLFNKRYGNLNKILGSGTFVSLNNETKVVFSSTFSSSNFKSSTAKTNSLPTNRKAA